jgi:hypothetical protein
MEEVLIWSTLLSAAIGYSLYLHSKIERIEHNAEVHEANVRVQIEWLTQKYIHIESSKVEAQRKPKAGAINSLKKIVKPTNKRTKE